MDPEIHPSSPCPCGSDASYEKCCGRFLEGGELPSTAEELMRSRYSAHALHRLPWLQETLYPASRSFMGSASVKGTSKHTQWKRLEILNTLEGGPADEQGWVEFKAWYMDAGMAQVHHERSRFQKEAGRWFYVDGHTPGPQAPPEQKLGRNDPCPCGSGKKYKKCCGK